MTDLKKYAWIGCVFIALGVMIALPTLSHTLNNIFSLSKPYYGEITLEGELTEEEKKALVDRMLVISLGLVGVIVVVGCLVAFGVYWRNKNKKGGWYEGLVVCLQKRNDWG